MSLVLGLIMLTVVAISAYVTLNLLIISSIKKGIFNYSELCGSVLGRWASITYDIVNLIYGFRVE